MQMRKFELLRNPADEGGSGGDAPAGPTIQEMSDQNAALAQRVGQLQTSLTNMQQQGETNARQTQIARAKAEADGIVTEAENAVNTAETSLASALEGGEPMEIAKAQRKLADASAGAERKRSERDNFVAQAKQAERRDGGARPDSATAAPQLNTSNLDQWKDRNKEWYGVDAEMTRVSHEVDQGVRTAGTYTVGSSEYFQAIDRALKQRFPDRFSGAPASAAAREGGSGQGGAPRRYDRDVQRSMDAFGLSAESWDAARAKAVEKGFLKETPTRGRVMS